ncbi:MAG: hypothetical protein JNM07_07840 [Phycisphaerae bacterium]|nr:hypothetical protein [Phycisphaerae bacterium]
MMNIRTAPRRSTLALLASAALAATGLSGCFKPGGAGMSIDQYTYWSTTHMPQTVTVVDTRTGQALWTCEIPVGQELVLKFSKNERIDDDPVYPDRMTWDVLPLGRESAPLTHHMFVPPYHARLVKVELRKSPELSPAMAAKPAESGVTQPVPTPAAAAPATTPGATEPAVDIPAGGGR